MNKPCQLTASFNKGADDVTGEMSSQIYDVQATKTLTKNAHKRADYALSGRKDFQVMVMPMSKLLKIIILEKRHKMEKLCEGS